MMRVRIPIRGDKLYSMAAVKGTVYRESSRFQKIEIMDTVPYGRALLLDGHIQLTMLDEHAYHESLVHIPLLSLASPTRALVIGGGDGGVLRELCRHSCLQQIDLVEIDERVIAACREYLPSVSDGAFDDPRVRVHVADAFEFVPNFPGAFDIIVADSTDVYEEESDGSLSAPLFTDQFYRICRDALATGGVLVTQADNPIFCPYSLKRIRGMLSTVFERTGSYVAIVPSFGGLSAFCWASSGTAVSSDHSDKIPALNLRYLSAETYALAFAELRF